MVVVKAGDMWDKLVLVAGRVCLAEDSVKAGDEGKFTVTVLVDSADRDTRLGDFDSILIFSWCGVLWFLGPAA